VIIRRLKRGDRVVFVSFAIGLVLTLTVSLLSLALLNVTLTSTLLSESNSLPNTASVVNTALGLRFSLSLNRSSLASGEFVVVQVSDQNILSTSNRLNQSNDWRAKGLGVGPCGALAEWHPPIGLAIFRGYYTVSNLWLANGLTLYGPGLYHCPLIRGDMSSYVFAPNNDSAEFYGPCNLSPCFTTPMLLSRSFTGFWSGAPYFSPTGTFHTFSPGVYTVVGGDEWGDIAVLHFVVS